MAAKEDMLFYAGYGFVFIMLGLMILLFSIGFLDGWTAFGVWLLSMSLVLIGLGSVRTGAAPQGSGMLVGTGLFFTIISIVILGIILEFLNPLTAFAVLILLLGLGILTLGVRKTRSAS